MDWAEVWGDSRIAPGGPPEPGMCAAFHAAISSAPRRGGGPARQRGRFPRAGEIRAGAWRWAAAHGPRYAFDPNPSTMWARALEDVTGGE